MNERPGGIGLLGAGRQTLEDTMKFAIGDKVRIIADVPMYGWGWANKGMIGTVGALRQDNYGNNADDGVNPMRVFIKELDYGTRNPWWNCTEDEIELLEATADPCA